jgi:hypothetical protein
MHPVSGPELATVHAPARYSVEQIVEAVGLTLQATELLGQRGGVVRGEHGGVIGVYGDRGLFILATPPKGNR